MSEQPIPTPADVAPKAPDASPEPAAAVPAPESPDPAKSNVWENPETAKAEIERLRRENGAARTNAKQQAADEARAELAQTIGKALGIVKDDETVDPAKLAEQAATSQADARTARVELAVFRNAAAAGADPQALLDSASFLAKTATLDPNDGAAITAAIAAAVEANPRLGVAPASRVPAPNPAQGSSAAGAVGAPQQMSKADVERMYAEKDYAGIEKARQEGRLANLLGG